MESEHYLLEWAFHYAQHKSVFKAGGEQVEKKDSTVVAKSGETTTIYLPVPELDGFKSPVPKAHETIYLVTFNTDDNLDALVKHWAALSAHRNVLIIFINPLSKLDTKWSIHPYIHNKICDTKALKSGLKSLFANVDPLPKTKIKGLEL